MSNDLVAQTTQIKDLPNTGAVKKTVVNAGNGGKKEEEVRQKEVGQDEVTENPIASPLGEKTKKSASGNMLEEALSITNPTVANILWEILHGSSNGDKAGAIAHLDKINTLSHETKTLSDQTINYLKELLGKTKDQLTGADKDFITKLYNGNRKEAGKIIGKKLDNETALTADKTTLTKGGSPEVKATGTGENAKINATGKASKTGAGVAGGGERMTQEGFENYCKAVQDKYGKKAPEAFNKIKLWLDNGVVPPPKGNEIINKMIRSYEAGLFNPGSLLPSGARTAEEVAADNGAETLTDQEKIDLGNMVAEYLS